jgi:hypothetical protein
MVVSIIYILQGYHIHYEMYMVARKLRILLLFFFLYYKIFLFKNEIIEGYLNEIFQPLFFLFFKAYFQLNKERNFNIQDNIFQAREKD